MPTDEPADQLILESRRLGDLVNGHPEHVDHDHHDPRVRLALAQALPGGVDVVDDLRDRVIDVLTRRTRDPEPRVRDWAAFGLGQLQARSLPARDALAALLVDPDHDTRCEALLALAGADDERALPVLRRLLEDGGEVCRLELEAAAALAAPDLHPACGSWPRAGPGTRTSSPTS